MRSKTLNSRDEKLLKHLGAITSLIASLAFLISITYITGFFGANGLHWMEIPISLLDITATAIRLAPNLISQIIILLVLFLILEKSYKDLNLEKDKNTLTSNDELLNRVGVRIDINNSTNEELLKEHARLESVKEELIEEKQRLELLPSDMREALNALHSPSLV